VNALHLPLPVALTKHLQGMASAARWSPGNSTAEGAAAAVKSCDVAHVMGNPGYDESWAMALAELYKFLGSERVRDFALPRGVFGARFVSYGPGQSYGAHTDEPVSASGRADLSFTILLQEPIAGGVLVVDGERVHLGAGQIVIYPSTLVHEVTEVSEGTRIALVGWIESCVRCASRRRILSDLQFILENDYDANRVRAVRNELLRLWS
jgi:PKHD-type hydroxylase